MEVEEEAEVPTLDYTWNTDRRSWTALEAEEKTAFRTAEAAEMRIDSRQLRTFASTELCSSFAQVSSVARVAAVAKIAAVARIAAVATDCYTCFANSAIIFVSDRSNNFELQAS